MHIYDIRITVYYIKIQDTVLMLCIPSNFIANSMQLFCINFLCINTNNLGQDVSFMKL